MKNFVIDEAVFEKLPDYCVGLVVAKGVDNKNVSEEIQNFLDQEVKNFAEKYADANIREIRNIDACRQAFYQMDMNPNKFMCSIEALAKRAKKNGVLPHISTVVDLGNAFSVKYVLPMGAHDIDKCPSDLMVRFAKDGDTFLPLGEEEIENVPSGELVYASGDTVKTRRWIWRQSDDGKITEESTNLVFPIDGFMNVDKDDVINARDELAQMLKAEFSCDVKVGFVNKDSNSMEL
jgi:DNA/RNA-binding domain of Phe-tRNA-synthetase-like protein